MRMLDLFSGIGGFALAAETVWRDELDLVAFCEIDPYCHKVLNKNFPQVPIHEDIKILDGTAFKDIDLLTGGFPCQDISVAGRGEGLSGDRSYLWFEMLRIIRDVRPRYALVENVPMLTSRGGTRVLADLAEIGYNAEWTIISARDVGARHLRKRIWIVAYPESKRGKRRKTGKQRLNSQRKQRISGRNSTGEVPNTDSGRLERSSQKQGRAGNAVGSNREAREREVSNSDIHGEEWDKSKDRKRRGSVQVHTKVSNTDSQRLQRSEETGDTQEEGKEPQDQFLTRLSRGETYWETEPNIRRVANGVPSRVDRIKGLGNAIVPQVATVIMQKIKNNM